MAKKKTKKPNAKTLLNALKKKWKQDVRDNWDNCCAKCGKTDCKLDTHHLVYHKELKWTEPEVGVLLCSGCHKLSHQSAHSGGLLFYHWFFQEHPVLYLKVLKLVEGINGK